MLRSQNITLRERKVRSLIIGSLIMMGLFVLPSQGFSVKEYDWDGSSSTNWVTSDNWDPAPGTGTGVRVYIVGGPGTYTNAPTISSSPSFDIDYIDLNDGGQLTQTGGTVDVDEDMAIYNGADYVISGGTMNIGDDLYIYDSGSSLTCSGGTLAVVGTIYLGLQHPSRADGTNGSPTLTVSGGVVTCTSIVFDDAEGDTPQMTVSSGSVTISGNLQSDGEDVDLTISGTGTVDIGGNLEMDGGSDDLTMTGGDLELAGNWTNTGTTSLSAGTITFDGGSAQQITNTSGETFYNLEIDNSSTGVTLNDPITIDNSMTLTDGIVTGSSTNDITFEDGATVGSASSASFVDGPVTKVGNETFEFPLGDGSVFRPLDISAPSSASDEFSAQYINSNPDASYSTSSLGTGLNNVSIVEYWILDRDAGSSNVTVTLEWGATSAVGNLTDLRVARWDGSDWESEGNGGTTGNTTSGTIVTSGSVTSFSPFTFGSVSSSNPLPVELISFDARADDFDNATLSWSTASEVNSSHFEVERSDESTSEFTMIAHVPSQAKSGYSATTLDYQLTDPSLNAGIYYYRLKQVDLDGAHEYSDVKVVSISDQVETDPVVFPNPSDGQELFLQHAGLLITEVYLIDVHGRRVPLDMEAGQGDLSVLHPAKTLSSGVYALVIEAQGVAPKHINNVVIK